MANDITVRIEQLSQDISANTSYIKVTLTANFLWWARSEISSTGYIQIDGKQTTFTIPPYDVATGASLFLGTFNKTIIHDADGTRSVSAHATWAPPYVAPMGTKFTGAQTVYLSTIPRASSFSVTGNTLGSSLTVNITRASSGFTHIVRYQLGNISRDYTGQTTSCAFTPPLTDASQFPNSGSGQGTITVFTYNGATLIGTKSASVTLNLPSSILPTFTTLNITRVDNGVPTAFGVYVQNKSKANLSIIGAAGIYGSTIKTYKISGGGYSADTSSLNTGVISTSGMVTFTGTITDSRGRTATKTISIMVYENALPSLTLKAERCTSTGAINNNGTYLKITPTYSCASVNAKNCIASKTFSISGTSYKNTTGVSGTSFILGNNDILISKSYDVTGVVLDALGQSSGTITIKVSSSSVPINMRDDQTGIAFGKYSEKIFAIESDWEMYIKGGKVIRVPPGVTINERGLILLYKVDILNIEFSFSHYYCNSCMNIPTSHAGWLCVNNVSDEYVNLVYKEVFGDVYERKKVNSVWYEWEKISGERMIALNLTTELYIPQDKNYVIPFNSVNNLSLKDFDFVSATNEVKIVNNDINGVLVSFGAFGAGFNTNWSNYMFLIIYKNKTKIVGQSISYGNTYKSAALSNIYIPVSLNDTLQFVFNQNIASPDAYLRADGGTYATIKVAK